MLRSIAAAGACVALLGGCSGLKTYPNDHDRNALVRVKNEGGGFFSKTRPDVHLYSVDAACRATYLEFVFSKSTFGGSHAATAIEMMATPRKGVRYEFDVAYLSNGYTATGREFQQGKGRELEHRRLRDCVASKKAGA